MITILSFSGIKTGLLVFSRIARRHCPALYHTLESIPMKRTQSSSISANQFLLLCSQTVLRALVSEDNACTRCHVMTHSSLR